jgi:hypothetical protein
MPGPFGKVTSVEACADAFVRAIERRRRTIHVPRSLGWLSAVRWLLSTRLADWLLARRARRLVPQLEEQVRALGRAFGRQSVADDTKKAA